MALPVFKRIPQLSGVFIDLLDHAFGLLELLDGVLQLPVEHAPVGDHDNGIEQALGVVGFLIERSQLMSKPGDGVGFARARGMLHEIILPDAIGLDEFQDMADHVQLVVAGKDKGFGRLFDNGTSCRVVGPFRDLLHMQIVMDQLQQRVRLPYVLPQIMGLVPVRVDGILAVLVEGEEAGLLALQVGGHGGLLVADGKMHETALERQQRLALGSLSCLYCFSAFSSI